MSYVAVYDRTIYYNPANKYSIIRVKSTDQSVPQQARDAYRHRDNMIRFVAVGYELPQTDKVSMLLEGEWQNGKHGIQFKVDKYEEIVPQTEDGVRGYLSSRLIKGVGPKIAQLIVDRFGVDALNIIENQPERLLEIKGITPQKLEDIQNSFSESRCMRDLMILLSPYQITPAAATKIYEHFGARSVEILQDNPYELCQVSGFGFRRVDEIARKNDMPFNSSKRIRGAIFATMDAQRQEHGHLYLPEDAVKTSTARLLNEKQPIPQYHVKPSEIQPVLEKLILHGELVSSNGNIYQLQVFAQEDDTARHIAALLALKPDAMDITQALEHIRSELGINLSQRQCEAVYMAFRSNLSIITGSPGTGKTTVLRAIIQVFRYLCPKGKILLAAPTGRASRRMAESTGFMTAKTLHSLLGLVGENDFSKEKPEPLDADLIIVDESSMIDMWLARQFFTRIRPETRVVLVGDVDQLQSVGAGDVFRQLIGSGLIPVTVLNQIFRQSEDSRIAVNAQRINAGDTRLAFGEDFRFIRSDTQEEAANVICRIYLNLVNQYGIEKVQILSPYRTEGACSTDQLNLVIREMVNPPREDDFDLKVGSNFFRVGDKVMQRKNIEKVSNGDIGYIRKMLRNDKGDMRVTIEFSDSRIVEYEMEDMTHIELAYATTIHKAMGSEYDYVVMPIIRSHAHMLSRNIFYTAVTRAKKEVYLVGQKAALMVAIHKKVDGKRHTMLAERTGKYLKVFNAKLEQMKKAA